MEEGCPNDGRTSQGGGSGSEFDGLVPRGSALVILRNTDVAAGLGGRTAVELLAANEDVAADRARSELHDSDCELIELGGEASGVDGVLDAFGPQDGLVSLVDLFGSLGITSTVGVVLHHLGFPSLL